MPVSLKERKAALANLEMLHRAARRENAGSHNVVAADCPYSDIDTPGVVAFTGQEGSGKSLSMTAWLAQAFANGYRVVTNNAVIFGEPLDFDLWQRGGYFNCVIGIDELYELFARYRAQSSIQVEAVGSLITLRHQRIQLFVSAQDLNEINRSVITRIGLEIRCYKNDGGYEIPQKRTWQPGQRFPKSRRVLAQQMRKYWPFYDHERRIEVGALRQSPSARKASAEIDTAQQVWRAAAGYVAAGDVTLSTVKIQLALKEHEGMTVSTAKVGAILAGLDFEPSRSSKARVWTPPQSFLDQFHPSGAVAQAAELVEPADGGEVAPS